MTQTTDGAFKLIENMAAFSANENQESDRSEKVNSADVGEKYSMKGLLQLPGSCPQQVPDSCPQVPGSYPQVPTSYPWVWVLPLASWPNDLSCLRINGNLPLIRY